MLSPPTKNQRTIYNQLAELVASFIYSECYSPQGTSSNRSSVTARMQVQILLADTRLHGSVLPSKQKFTLALSRILSSLLWGEYLVPSSPPDASHLCARGKGRGLTIKGEPCKRVFYVSVAKPLVCSLKTSWWSPLVLKPHPDF